MEQVYKMPKTVDKYVKLTEEVKSISKRAAGLEQRLIEAAERERTKFAVEGQDESTIVLQGKEHEVAITSKARFKGISSTHEPELKKTYKARFPQYFQKTTKLKFKGKGITPEQVEELRTLLGDQFDEYFDVTEEILVTPKYHQDRTLDPKIGSKLVSQYKPSVKARK